MANSRHVALVKKGPAEIARWRQKNRSGRLDFSRAELAKAYLAGSNLFEADLSWANLAGANLAGANLAGANLTGANLTFSNLSFANLSLATLSETNLEGADLSSAKLLRGTMFHANLSWANLAGANLANAEFGATTVGMCDLSQSAGLDTIQHSTPSSIGVDTLITSFRGAGNKLTPQLEAFFRSAGVPDAFLSQLESVVQTIRYHTCLISYGAPDGPFAEKLWRDLWAKGVSCWLYVKDAAHVERGAREPGDERRDAEKMILLCSAKALMADNFLYDMVDRIEADPDSILSVSMDDRWQRDDFPALMGTPNLRIFFRGRTHTDFGDTISYEESLERLLKQLRRPES